MATFFEPKKKNYALRRTVAIAIIVAVAVAIAFLLKGLLGESGAKKKHVVQQVMLIKPPPLPPPPPKPPEKPPEVKKEEVKIEQPKPTVEPKSESNQPEAKQLGVDAEGNGAGDAFGLIGNKGGRDLLSDSGAKYTWYAAIVQQSLYDAIAKNKKLRTAEFRVVVHVWIKPNGTVQRSEIIGSSGKSDTDELIRAALGEMPPLKELPPNDLPQPVRLRLANRL